MCGAWSKCYKQFEVPILFWLETRTFHNHNDDLPPHITAISLFRLQLIPLTIESDHNVIIGSSGHDLLGNILDTHSEDLFSIEQ